MPGLSAAGASGKRRAPRRSAPGAPSPGRGGRGEPEPREGARQFEEEALAGCGDWCRGLEEAGLEADRRALRARAHELAWRWRGEDALELAFTLASGAYATALLREVAAPGQAFRST